LRRFHARSDGTYGAKRSLGDLQEIAVSVDDLTAVAFTLNRRPRKTLGWRTPAEALDKFLQAHSPASVATTS
jgi:hypothetical protein